MGRARGSIGRFERASGNDGDHGVRPGNQLVVVIGFRQAEGDVPDYVEFGAEVAAR